MPKTYKMEPNEEIIDNGGFFKYQHIERLGATEVNGILEGECYVFPKIDGTNSCLWWGENKLQAGSRNRHLSLGSDNAGFYNWAIGQEVFVEFFKKYPKLRLYGEWLVPHTLRTYDDKAWRQFYVFDVIGPEGYLSYPEYSQILNEFGIEYIPAMFRVNNPTEQRMYECLESNTYLIKDGLGCGEGIVIKNYGFKNKYGRTTWAKIVRNEFKASHSKAEVRVVKERTQVEDAIVGKYITRSLIEKERSKIEMEAGDWSSKMIPRLLSTVYYCLISEESWNFVKEHKNPIIDFKKLAMLTTAKIKEVYPEVFWWPQSFHEKASEIVC